MSQANGQLKTALVIAGGTLFSGIAILLVWFFSPASIGVAGKSLISLLLLLPLPVFVLVRYFARARAAKRPAADGGSSVPQTTAGKKKTALPPPTGQYEEITRGAEEAVQWLRNTKLGDTKPGDTKATEAAVYALPWFAVSGPRESGKTSLLLASELNFHVLPSQRASEQSIIRPTAHNDWRVTDAAVLLDTSGRYQTEGAERDEWSALLETLKRHRRARPLDGFMLAVNAAAVLRMSPGDIDEEAKVLRARLDEAMARSGVRFPVYLVFTHLDEVEGFTEFFAGFDTAERAQVWGTTVPLAQSQNAQANFDDEFDQLYARLVRRRLVQLGAPATPEQQLKIFKFPGRFRRARGRLGQFAAALFRPNPFSESPLLRGFYFTSAIGAGAQGARRLNGDSYFTRTLFNDVLLRDKDIVRATQAAGGRSRLGRNLLVGAGATLLLLLIVGMLTSFYYNKRLIADADARGKRLTEVRKATSRTADRAPASALTSATSLPAEEMRAVEDVRLMLAQLDDYERESPPLLLRFGLYSGDTLNSSAPSSPSILRHLYFEAIDERFLKATVASVENDLRRFAGSTAPASAALVPASLTTQDKTTAPPASSATIDEENLGRHYDLLKAYLMLSKPERVEPTFLANTLREYWRAAAPAGMEEDALRQLDYFAGQADAEDAPHPEADAALVSAAQEKLVVYPVVNRVYKRLTAEINTDVRYPVRLSTISGASEGGVLTGSYAVPGSFTLDGHTQMTGKLASSAADEFRRDDWVMQGRDATAGNIDVRRDELAEMYYRDYTAQWQKFLQEIKVKEPASKEEAVRLLRSLSGSNSPIESVTREVARQTNFAAGAGGGFFGWVKSFFKSDTAGGSTPVEREFRPLHQFLSGEGDAASTAQYRAKLKSVHDALNASAKPLADISRSLQAGTDTIKLGDARRAIDELLEAKGFSQTPAAGDAARLLKQPLDNISALLVGTDYEQLAKLWQPLYTKAQALEAGFPFTDAGADVSVAVLAQFLNPQDGELTRFFKERLKPYFGDDWTIKPDAADKFTPEFAAYMKRARALRDALFPEGGKQPKVEYQLALAPAGDALIRVEIDGATISAPDKLSGNFVYPGDKSGVKLNVTPTGGADQARTFPGEWGMLHLFRESGGGEGQGAQFTLQPTVSATASSPAAAVNPPSIPTTTSSPTASPTPGAPATSMTGSPVRLTLQPKSGNIFTRELFRLKAPSSLGQKR